MKPARNLFFLLNVLLEHPYHLNGISTHKNRKGYYSVSQGSHPYDHNFTGCINKGFEERLERVTSTPEIIARTSRRCDDWAHWESL